LPGPMFCYYLRNMYLENNLRIPGKLTVAGEKVDLGAIDAPVFIYGSKEDHIVPWDAAFRSLALLNPSKPENNTFVLGASGHIAGVINPAAKKKRSHWVHGGGAASPAQWMDGAGEQAGSWWGAWSEFLKQHGGNAVDAPVLPGNADYPAGEPAPGSYVKARAD
jgi:polyhydroxyalkanoate synthase